MRLIHFYIPISLNSFKIQKKDGLVLCFYSLTSNFFWNHFKIFLFVNFVCRYLVLWNNIRLALEFTDADTEHKREEFKKNYCQESLQLKNIR